MNTLIHPTYFPNIATFVAISKACNVVFEMEDNFIKQTYRNRTYIYGANGKLSLNIPLVFSQKNRQKYKDVKIFNEDKWQSQHWKSILSAYRTSPFFEYYEDELYPIFKKQNTFLLDYNLECFQVIIDCLQLDLNVSKTASYEKIASNALDYRFLVNSRKETPQKLQKYTQVFDQKHGYIPNLSIIDLLFNEGPNALSYLEAQTITFASQ